jgi:hypothetical protein
MPDCCVALGLESRELPVLDILECKAFIFCFCFANATSLAEAFLYMILGGVELRKRKNLHDCPANTEP